MTSSTNAGIVEHAADRVEFQDEELDEIVATRGAHLERVGQNRWFIRFSHADGTETALWFSSRDLRKPMWETRRPTLNDRGEAGS